MKKNILIFGHNYATQFIDVCNQYVRLFDPQQYHVTVAYLSGTPDENIRKKTLADEVIFLNFSRKSIRGLKLTAIQKMLSLCREKSFDIVIAHRYKPSYIMLWVAQFCPHQYPLFVMHDLHTMEHAARKALIATLWRSNMFFAGVSNAVRDDIRKSLWRVPTSHIITLYNVLDIELTEPRLLSRTDARSHLQLTEDDFVFGNIARLEYAKDQKTLIQAFALIKPHCPRAKLLIMGDGALEATLKEQTASLGLTNDIIFTGFVPDGFRFMKAFDIFVLNSIREAFGRVLLESMTARTPIIGSRVNGIPEVIGDSGFLIDAGNIQQLASAMQNCYALSQTELADWGNKGYQRMFDHFSIPRFNEVFWQFPLSTQELI